MTDEKEDPKPPAEDSTPALGEAPEVVAEAAAGASPDVVFEALWKRVVEAWDEDKPHQAILEHALRSQMLPDLAGRYRALKDDPDKGARAQKRIDKIVAAATQMLMATKTPTATKTPWQWTASAAVMFIFVIGWLAYKLIIVRHH